MNTSIEIRLVSSPLFFAEAPAGYPNKNSNNRKTESARGTMGRGKRRESLPYNAFKMAPNFFFFLSFFFFFSFPFPSSPARFLFSSLQPSLRYKEASAENRVPSRYLWVFFSETIGVRLAPQLNPNLPFGHESELRWWARQVDLK